MKKSHIKTYIIVAILISIIGISIAYAALQQQLQIKTNASVQSSQTSWNIVIEKDYCTQRGYTTNTGDMTVNGLTLTISNYTFKAPNDRFTCYFYIENKGEIDAKISSLDYKEPTISGTGSTATEDSALVKTNLWKALNWYNWPSLSPISKGDKVLAGEKKRAEITYSINETMTTLPTNPVTFTNATYTINFEQA